MTDLAHHRAASAEPRYAAPAGPTPGPLHADAFGQLVAVLRHVSARPGLERLTMVDVACEAAAAGAAALRARGCGPEGMLVQLKHALTVGTLPLHVAGLAEELSEHVIRHAIAAYYDER